MTKSVAFLSFKRGEILFQCECKALNMKVALRRQQITEKIKV